MSIVAVVGSINVDLTTYVERLPRPGETVTGGTFRQSHGGKGGNQAVAIARLGGDVVLVGAVGDDDFGSAAIAGLAGEGIDVGDVRRGSTHTGVAETVVDSSGENLIAVASGANRELSGEMVEESLRRIDSDDAVVLSVLEVPDEAVGAAATVARKRGWRFILNPAPARRLSDKLISMCEVVTPNEHEIAGLGRSSPEDLLAAGARAVVVTLGRRGAMLWRAGREPHHQVAFDVDVVDSTGAGDTFSGTLAWALSDGTSLESAVELAAAAGALSATREGARGGMPSRDQLETIMSERSTQP